jgi:hypothetical protein
VINCSSEPHNGGVKLSSRLVDRSQLVRTRIEVQMSRVLDGLAAYPKCVIRHALGNRRSIRASCRSVPNVLHCHT